MKTRRADEAGATVLELDGRLDGTAAEPLHQTLIELIAEAPPRLVLDLGGMSYVSSAGLRILLLAAKQARGSNIKLVLCALRPNVEEVFAAALSSVSISAFVGRASERTSGLPCQTICASSCSSLKPSVSRLSPRASSASATASTHSAIEP